MDLKRYLGARRTRRQILGGAAAASLAGAYRPQGVVRAQSDVGGHVRAVVSAYEEATSAGMAMLEAGGTAADAAIAIASVLTVVEGWFSSVLGGGTWGLYFDAAAGEVTSLDGVGPTGAKATREDYEARADTSGIHQANVPGAWDGWMLWLDRYGRLDLGEVLAPAIDLARNGFEASADHVFWAGILEDEIFEFPGSERIYAANGSLPEEGDTLVNPHLAETFDALVAAYDGALPQSRTAAVQAARDYYYRGPIAEAIVAFSD